MKIIKQGIVPEEVVYRTTCSKCDTEFEFAQREAKLTSDQRDGDFVSIPCPTCGQTCTTDYITPKQYAARIRANETVARHL